MTTPNAIKKLEKAGYTVKLVSGNKNRQYTATKDNHRRFINFYDQEGHVIIIDLRTKGHEDDSMTDYHAGTFCDNISQALRLAQN